MVGAKKQRHLALHVTEQVETEHLLGPRTVQREVDGPQVCHGTDCEEHQRPRMVREDLQPEELHSALGPTLHGAEVVGIQLGDARGDLLLHVHAALAHAELDVRRRGVLDLCPGVEILQGLGVLALPAELGGVDLPHRVRATGRDASTTVADNIHEIEAEAVVHVQHVVLHLHGREELRRLHQRDLRVRLVLVARLRGVHELGQHVLPIVGVRLMPRVEDAIEHALGRGVALLTRADVAVAELERVHNVVQAATLAANAGVWHQQVLLHDDSGVAVHHPPHVRGHLDVGELALADRLDQLAWSRHLGDEVGALAPRLDLEAAQLLRRSSGGLLQLRAELAYEVLG
mmetsp:Transcript_114277/g.369203  ORF Transcript_114277/g.369203 Transcript_114277/m.369203 type:complete len:345 (-) Transcript_114277:1389-2423(-)